MLCAPARARAWRCFPACGSRRPSLLLPRGLLLFSAGDLKVFPLSVSEQTVEVPTAHSPQRMNGRPGTRAEVAPHSTLFSFTTTCAARPHCALLHAQTARMTLAGGAGAGTRPVWLARGEAHDFSERCVRGQPALKAYWVLCVQYVEQAVLSGQGCGQAGARGHAALLLLLLLSLSLRLSVCM